MVAKERNSINNRINLALKERRKKVKLYEPFLKHAEFLLDAADTLRDYRNYYVHGAICLENAELQLLKVSARKRFAIHGAPLESEDVKRVIEEITKLEEYAVSLINALSKNNSAKTGSRPKWPKIPAPPEKLKLRRIIFDGALPSFVK